jgi:hypothetical protein
MYSVTVRDHVMIAHSFTGRVFGPASAFMAPPTWWTSSSSVRISTPTASWPTSGASPRRCGVVLADLNYRNLDEVPAFVGRNTTTEFLARVVFDGLVATIRTWRP